MNFGNSTISVSDGLTERFPFENVTVAVSNTSVEVNTPASVLYPFTITASVEMSNDSCVDLNVTAGICGQAFPVCTAQFNLTCPREAACNITALRDANDNVSVVVSVGSTTLMNTTIAESVLQSDTTVLQSNSLVFALRSVNGTIVLDATERVCLFCKAESLIANATGLGNDSGPGCPGRVTCNVTAVRNQNAGNLSVQVFTVNETFLNMALQESSLNGSGVTFLVNNSVELTLVSTSDVIELTAVKNRCPFCAARSFITNATGSTCPQTVVCNVTAIRNASGGLVVQVTTGDAILLNTSLLESALSNSNSTFAVNSSLQLTLASSSGSVSLYAMDNQCPYCSAQAVITNATQPGSGNHSTCPQPTICNVTAIRNTSGGLAVQVTAGDAILLNTSLLESALSNSNSTFAVNSSLQLSLTSANGFVVLLAMNNMCPYCSTQAYISNATGTRSGNENAGFSCPAVVTCNMTATRNGPGSVAIEVTTPHSTLLNTSLFESLLYNGTTVSLNNTLQLSITGSSYMILLFATENGCSFCNATALIINATQSGSANNSNSSNSTGTTCPALVFCNITALRNATGSIAVQVLTANMTLLNASFSESSLLGNGTKLQDDHSKVQIALRKKVDGLIELLAVNNTCPYCYSNDTFIKTESSCPHEVACDAAAINNSNGSVSVQVSVESDILLSILLPASMLNDTKMIMQDNNKSLTFMLQGSNGSIKVLVADNDTCVLCELVALIAVSQPPAILLCACTSQQRCVNGTCQSIATSVISVNTVKLAFNAPVSMVSYTEYNVCIQYNISHMLTFVLRGAPQSRKAIYIVANSK